MRAMKFVTLAFVLLLVLLLIENSFAAMRGIRATSKHGEELFLYKDYHALVVGISDYDRWPDLPNAAKDAKEVAGKLMEMGFTVRLALNPTSQEMRLLLNELVYDIGGESDVAALVYFAGHGETETLADNTKMGYLIPKNCPLLRDDPKGFALNAIGMREIEAFSLRIKAKHVLMLFDSCFSGSLFSLVRAVPHDISEKSTLPVRQYITAGREEEQVPDKSMFKRCFLIGLEGDADLTGDGYITGSELGLYLSEKVVNYTRRRQHPQYGKINNPSLDRGDFIFVPPEVHQAKAEVEERSLMQEQEEEGESLRPARKTPTQVVYLPRERPSESEIRRIKLRSEPDSIDYSEIKDMVREYDFFIKGINDDGDFPNQFVDNGDGSITDHTTGLMWLKGGSSEKLEWRQAKKYVSALNRDRFLGHDEWRIPTIEELTSLLESKRNRNNQYIDNQFSADQGMCWSSDDDPGTRSASKHSVDFTTGKIRPGRSDERIGHTDSIIGRIDRYYARPARSIR
jgi:hypothetical protein